MAQYLPPMSGAQENRVQPGPVRGGACPSPSEIVVVEVRKVFDFCFQEDMLERCFFVPGLGPDATVTGCEITQVTCREILDREPLENQNGLALVSVRVSLDLTLTIVPTVGGTPFTVRRRIAFPKRVVLCAPMGTDVTCDVRGTCICTVQPQAGVDSSTDPNICCTIQLCLTIKSWADVNIMVPSFGVVAPKQCRVSPAFGGCPPMPPQGCGDQGLDP